MEQWTVLAETLALAFLAPAHQKEISDLIQKQTLLPKKEKKEGVNLWLESQSLGPRGTLPLLPVRPRWSLSIAEPGVLT